MHQRITYTVLVFLLWGGVSAAAEGLLSRQPSLPAAPESPYASDEDPNAPFKLPEGKWMFIRTKQFEEADSWEAEIYFEVLDKSEAPPDLKPFKVRYEELKNEVNSWRYYRQKYDRLQGFLSYNVNYFERNHYRINSLYYTLSENSRGRIVKPTDLERFIAKATVYDSAQSKLKLSYFPDTYLPKNSGSLYFIREAGQTFLFGPEELVSFGKAMTAMDYGWEHAYTVAEAFKHADGPTFISIRVKNSPVGHLTPAITQASVF